MSLPYTFPPAAGYPLNRCLYRLKSDDAFRERYLKDPDGTLREAGLDSERIAALRALDRHGLLALGAHAYLVRDQVSHSYIPGDLCSASDHLPSPDVGL